MHQIKPTTSFAGTPRDRMADALASVANALEAAQRLMGEATPNGRDYMINRSGRSIAASRIVASGSSRSWCGNTGPRQ